MGDYKSTFAAFMQSVGLPPPDNIIDDGAIHRFSVSSKKRDDSGFYILYGDGTPAGCVGNWKTGFKQTWRADVGRPLSQREEDQYRTRLAVMRKQRAEEERKRHEEAASRAQDIWQQSTPASDSFRYLVKKSVRAFTLRLHYRRLVVPLRDSQGRIWSLQFIDAHGNKRFLTGGRKKGLFHVLGKPVDQVVICEGYATAASIFMATGIPTVIAFDAGNLEDVAFTLRTRLPKAALVIAADNDAFSPVNIGIEKAQSAASMAKSRILVPTFEDTTGKPTDWNDYAALYGLNAVRQQFAEVTHDSAA